MVTIDFGDNQASTVRAVDAWYETNYKPRNRLGLSSAGHSCPRFLWLTNKFEEKKPDGRTLRLFQLGNLIEQQVIIDLKSTGFVIHSQQKEICFTSDNLKLFGHIDGQIEGLLESKLPHLLEIKSANDKQFNSFLKLGVQAWNEKYYWQCQFYMLGMKLKRCAFFVYNKDNSIKEMERLHLDKEKTIERLQFVFESIYNINPPERQCPRSNWFAAKFCNQSDRCW